MSILSLTILEPESSIQSQGIIVLSGISTTSPGTSYELSIDIS